MMRSTWARRLLIVALAVCAVSAGGAVRIVQDQCGPFTDVTPGFCPYVLELYYLGITVGTSTTTFSPDDPLTRGQAAVFVAKGFDQSLARSSRRAALGQWWTTTPHWFDGLGVTAVGALPKFVATDGSDLWVTHDDGSISRVRASDGRLLETWTGTSIPGGVLVAMGRVFVPGYQFTPSVKGFLYMIDPSQAAGTPTIVSSSLGFYATGIAFDGNRIWTANNDGNGGSVSIVTPGSSLPWSTTTVTTGFSRPLGILFDGNAMWVTDNTAKALLKLDSTGTILQTVPLGGEPWFPAFDGENLWVPTQNSGSVTVVQASTGTVLATLTDNFISLPTTAAFDGQRVLVTGQDPIASTVALWKAADLTPIGSFGTAPDTAPFGACSDGINFWIALRASGQLARF